MLECYRSREPPPPPITTPWGDWCVIATKRVPPRPKEGLAMPSATPDTASPCAHPAPSTTDNRPRNTDQSIRNRLNAQHSTGPTSPDGKSRSAQNATNIPLHHHLFNPALLLPGEDQ